MNILVLISSITPFVEFVIHKLSMNECHIRERKRGQRERKKER